MVKSDLRAKVEMAVPCMRNASGHNYRNSSATVDLAIGQLPRFMNVFLHCISKTSPTFLAVTIESIVGFS